MNGTPPDTSNANTTATEQTQSRPVDLAAAKALKLQVIPPVAVRLQSVLERDDYSLADVEREVARDPALSAQVLRMANSPYFGLGRAVATLRQALFVLGMDLTRQLAFGLAVTALNASKKPMRHHLWWHSIRTAGATQLISREFCDRVDLGEAFLAGLLHDVGKAVLLEAYEPAYLPLLTRQFHAGDELRQQERSLFGFDHTELGAVCLERWNLPPATCARVLFHHRPAMADDSIRSHVAAVHLANALEHGLASGVRSEQLAEELSTDPEAARMALQPSTLLRVINDLTEQSESIAVLMGGA